MKTKPVEGKPASQDPSKTEVRETMRRILASRHFVNAPTKQRFLRLICEYYLNGRASELNEYMIGCELYDRDESYNPALDPIVRVGAHGLRKRLEAYYKGEGKDDEIILEIPHGSYAPNFIRRAAPQESSELANGAADAPALVAFIENNSKILLNLLVLSLVIITITLAYSNTQLRRQTKASAQSREMSGIFESVWGSFLKDGNPALLVLGNPSVYRFWHPTDPTSLSKMRVDLTLEEAKIMGDTLGRERLVVNNPPNSQLMLAYDEYACLGEAIGLYRLTGLFNRMGKNLTLKQNRRLVAEDLKNHNAILFGNSWVKEWVGNSPVRKCFTSGPAAAISDQNLLPGDEREYVAKYDKETGKLIEDYALIVVKPGISERKTVMIVAGTRSEGTQAAVEYLTDENYLVDLNQRFHRTIGAFPKYFQVLLKVSVDNGIPTDISVIRVRELRFSADHP
ncbi:MAG TPA: hypothetical protein VHR27_11565 [Blastocatellia bacterium]|nr:hypothetical protein [Blastocatellia bacterium]